MTVDGREAWRDVLGWEGLYQVSSLGRLKRLARTVRAKNGSTAVRVEAFIGMKPNRRTGYVEALLRCGDRKRRGNAHILVCEAFHGPRPSPSHQVAHGDGTRANNRADNLRWALPIENTHDKYRHGTMPQRELHANHVLRQAQVDAIRREHTGAYGEVIGFARRFGVSRTTIHLILNGQAWREAA